MKSVRENLENIYGIAKKHIVFPKLSEEMTLEELVESGMTYAYKVKYGNFIINRSSDLTTKEIYISFELLNDDDASGVEKILTTDWKTIDEMEKFVNRYPAFEPVIDAFSKLLTKWFILSETLKRIRIEYNCNRAVDNLNAIEEKINGLIEELNN